MADKQSEVLFVRLTPELKRRLRATQAAWTARDARRWSLSDVARHLLAHSPLAEGAQDHG